MSQFLKSFQRWAGGLALAVAPLAASAEQVDLLVVYDSYTKNYFNGQPDTVIRNWVEQANTMYKNSQVDVQLRLVGTLAHEETGSAMVDVLHNLRQDATVAQKREELGADFVTQIHKTGSCGVAYVAVNKGYAFGVIGPQCGPTTLAHELGHSMGLNHSRRQGNNGGLLYGYGLGHGVDGVFGTIMAYNQAYGAPRVPKFSNPAIQCNGLPCGIAAGQPEEADAARAINNVRTTIAGFMPTRVSTGTTPVPAEPPAPTPTPTEPVAGILANGTYALRAASSSKCANVDGSSTRDGARLTQWSCHLGSNQRWIFTHTGNDFYEVKAKHSGKCLEVASANASNGTALRQWSCNGANSQRWKVVANGDGSIRLSAKHSGKVAEVAGTSTYNGVALRQWDWQGGKNQRWQLLRVQ